MTTEDDMTTEDEATTTTEPRSISELLLLTTYQGMTDEEIDMLIEFKVNTEAYRKYTEYIAGELSAISLEQQTRFTEIGQEADRMFQILKARRPELVVIPNE